MRDFHWDEYIVDGRSGAEQRFCSCVKEWLDSHFQNNGSQQAESTNDSVERLEEYVGLERGTLAVFRENHKIRNVFTADAIQVLATVCRIDLGECFAVRELSNEEREYLIKKADEEQFVAMAAAGDSCWTESDRISLFLISSALQELSERRPGATTI
jgi:hypothetical protein